MYLRCTRSHEGTPEVLSGILSCPATLRKKMASLSVGLTFLLHWLNLYCNSLCISKLCNAHGINVCKVYYNMASNLIMASSKEKLISTYRLYHYFVVDMKIYIVTNCFCTYRQQSLWKRILKEHNWLSNCHRWVSTVFRYLRANFRTLGLG